jgi:hypothetical protein
MHEASSVIKVTISNNTLRIDKVTSFDSRYHRCTAMVTNFATRASMHHATHFINYVLPSDLRTISSISPISISLMLFHSGAFSWRHISLHLIRFISKHIFDFSHNFLRISGFRFRRLFLLIFDLHHYAFIAPLALFPWAFLYRRRSPTTASSAYIAMLCYLAKYLVSYRQYEFLLIYRISLLGTISRAKFLTKRRHFITASFDFELLSHTTLTRQRTSLLSRTPAVTISHCLAAKSAMCSSFRPFYKHHALLLFH